MTSLLKYRAFRALPIQIRYRQNRGDTDTSIGIGASLIVHTTMWSAAEEVVNMRGGWADPDLFL